MTEREELEKAMAALEQWHTVLADVAAEASLAGERRAVTVLFCDVIGM